MQAASKAILDIQELDIKMIRLMRVKKERLKELEKIQALKADMAHRVAEKDKQVMELKKEMRHGETRMREIQDKMNHLEEMQSAVKKMDEFNALTTQITHAGRDKNQLEHQLSDYTDKLAVEEELLTSFKENLRTSEKNSHSLELEIHDSISKINEEGQQLLKEREVLIPQIQSDLFRIYEKLLHNKKDRVVVPIENRTCSGCHIVLTAQHENLVRKGERLIFCEHCSRILYWQEVEVAEEGATRRRRRRTTTTTESNI